jgi:hypothetical protein
MKAYITIKASYPIKLDNYSTDENPRPTIDEIADYIREEEVYNIFENATDKLDIIVEVW